MRNIHYNLRANHQLDKLVKSKGILSKMTKKVSMEYQPMPTEQKTDLVSSHRQEETKEE